MEASRGSSVDELRERLAVLEEARRNGEGDMDKLEKAIGELHAKIDSAVSEWRNARMADEATKAKSQQAILERRETDRRERGKTALTVVGIGVTGIVALATFFGQLFGWFA